MKQLLLTACLLLSLAAISHAQSINIIPAPVKAEMKNGQFTITPKTVIVAAAAESKSVSFLNDYLDKLYGFRLKTAAKADRNYIKLVTPVFVKKPDNEERYTLNVDANGVSIQGDSYQGTFIGIQTLIQLLPPVKSTALKIPFTSIEDYPRFGYRGMMLDVSRHFFTVEFVKQYIDFLALHKMNTFHWHLTDDQGWRIEIKKHPELTTISSCRESTIIGHHPGKGEDHIKHCGIYTQEQVKEVVKYAADRFITVIPEIEMPGHAMAALAAYPELGCTGGPYKVQGTWGVLQDVFCAGNEKTFAFLQDVLDEVIPLFPSKYIHVGGDECPKDRWKVCPKCQKRIKDENLKDEHALQSYFIHRMEKYINSKGKQIIGWDEILEGGLAPNATVMSWRGEKGGIEAAKQHHNVIMTPTGWCYFDYSQSKKEDSLTIGGYLPVEKVYSYDPQPKELSAEDAKYILGGQANLWTEYITSPTKVQYMVFPRMAALSEALWSPKEKKNWKDFEPRMNDQIKRYQFWNVNYNPKGIKQGE